MRNELATECARRRAEQSWIEVTGNGDALLVITEKRSEYLTMALTPEAPLVIVRDGISRLADGVRAGAVSVLLAVELLNKLFIESGGHANASAIASAIIVAQARMLTSRVTSAPLPKLAAASVPAAAAAAAAAVSDDDDDDDDYEEKQPAKRARMLDEEYDTTFGGRTDAVRDLFEKSPQRMTLTAVCAAVHRKQASLFPNAHYRGIIGRALGVVFGRSVTKLTRGDGPPTYYVHLKAP